MDNVTLDNTIVNFEINYLLENKNPFLRGNFKNSPKNIVLRKVSGDESHPKKNSEYTFVAGLFEEKMCSEWLKSIDYGDSDFNVKSCEDNIEDLLSMENKRIVLKSTNDEKSHGKLSTGQIVGIVIGCVAFVAVVVVVVVIVVIRKKDNKGKSESLLPIVDTNPINK